MKTRTDFSPDRRDILVSALMFIVSFAVYVRTLGPSVVSVFDDTLEMQYIIPKLGIVHQTGYPLYTLLGKLFTLVVPVGDVAYRLNLFSAFACALAVAVLYLVIRQMVNHRVAAITGALLFAYSPTFWEQAVSAEVYGLQMFLVALILWLTLRYAIHSPQSAVFSLAFVLGLGLTHHRLIALLYPAIALYVLLINRNLARDFKTLARAAVVFLSPLVIYVYLPLRGAVGSADGTFQNTLAGFFEWTMASQYTVFLTSNPLNVQRGVMDYWVMFQDQLTGIGMVLALVGMTWLVRRPKEWLFLVVALVPVAGFAFNYHVPDVQVHFLTTFLLLAIFAGTGIDAIVTALERFENQFFKWTIVSPLIAFLFFIIPLYALGVSWHRVDLSTKWDVYDAGVDALSQPIEKEATIIGILGEMTRLRYLQTNLGLRAEVQTLAADLDADRLRAIDDAIKQNRAVYTTRSLQGLAEKYSLASQGTLIRVLPKPSRNAPPMSRVVDEPFGGIQLIGYDIDTTRLNALPNQWHLENGRVVRVTLYWRVDDKMDADAMVSLKLLREDQRVGGQIDHRPVNEAYPTTLWRKGEVIADTYNVPIFLGMTPTSYLVKVTMYDRNSGAVIGQKNLDVLALNADLYAPRREFWNIAHSTDIDFSIMSLEGYSLDLENMTMRAGDALPLTLVWRAGQNKLPDDLLLRIWLEDASGKTVTSRDNPISVGFPPFLWQANSFVRDWSSVRLPANVANGKYHVKLAVARNNQLLGSSLLPFIPTIVDLGQIEIKNRPHDMQLPAAKVGLEATFDNKMRLLGYDVIPDFPQRTVEVTLWWKSLALMDTPYSVFVHLLDKDDQVRSAADSEPGNGTLPTTGWIENEYLVDVHLLSLADLPKGVYRIEIGVYDPATGARLKLLDGQERIILRTVDVP